MESNGDDERSIVSSKEFSAEERAELRRMLEALKFKVKFWKVVGVWVKWIFWVIAGLISVKVLLAEWITMRLK